MIEIIDKKQCCGCSACMSICPKKCITMIEDNEGFLYPVIDKEQCINCGLCQKVCPILKQKSKQQEAIEVYACVNKDEKILKKSSSGGVFTSLAKVVIEQGGIVFGAMFDSDLNVIHGFVKDINDIKKLQGSKYVQSDMRNCFEEVKHFLKEGKTVLFSGTPCQVSGLKQFLQNDYENLITCDFICTGVPSPKIYRAFRDYYQEKYKLKLQNVQFRHKKNGWINFGMLYEFKKKKKYMCRYNSSYINAFYSHLTLRPACYDCKFKELKSNSDIKLGDHWLIKQVHPEFYNFNGVSFVLIETEKGSKLFNEVRSQFKVQLSSYQEVLDTNKAITNVSKQPIYREKLFSIIEDADAKKIVRIINQTTKKGLKERLHNLIFVVGSNVKSKIKRTK